MLTPDSTRKFRIAMVTAPDLKTARKLARLALKQHLAACANLLGRIESHYWWQGRLDHADEVLILFKTTQARLAALEKLIVASHPYDTPEFVVLSLSAGNRRYLRWVEQSVRP